MIKLDRISFILLFLFAFSISAQAQQGALKVGFVNAAKVLESAPQAQAATKRLEEEFAPRQQALVGDKRSLKQLEDKLARDADVIGDTERRDLERQIVNSRREIKRNEDEFREDLNIRRNEELAKLQRQIVATVQAMAKEQSFDLIVTDGVLFASDKTDITPAVLQRLEADFKANQAVKDKK